MELDESLRHELFDALDTTLGPRPAATLMAHLPPVGWADVATKHDLHELERRIDHRFEVVDVRFDSVERRLAGNDARLAAIDTRLEGMDARLRAVETGMRDLAGELRAEMAKQSRALFVALGGLIVGIATLAATAVGILLATGRIGAG